MPQDREHLLSIVVFPIPGDMLLSTTTGLESASSTASINKPTEKDVFVIYIHALRSGLYRIHMQGQTGRYVQMERISPGSLKA